MTSHFGWLDTDEQQRRTMLEVVDLFRDKGILDEIGIGTIRDTIANALFPRTRGRSRGPSASPIEWSRHSPCAP
jgi:hypothetical protein